jgi:hemerythrin
MNYKNDSYAAVHDDKNDRLIEWDSKYNLGIDFVDKQHRQLLELTNELFKACVEGTDKAEETFIKAAHKTADYVKQHFTAEEALHRKIQYPYRDWHHHLHETFVQEILDEVKRFEAGEVFMPNKFARYLRDWILSHIAVTDRHYADFMQKGIATPPPGYSEG